MNAFTVTTAHEEWTALTEECVMRLRRHAKVSALVITAQDEFDAHVQKLTVPLSCHAPMWFFDSDWWMMRDAELPEIPKDGIIGTYCRSGHERYCNSCVDLNIVFGSTIFGADMSNRRVRLAFCNALHLQSEFFWNGKPKADESFLNIAAQQLGIPVKFMDAEWNHCAAPESDTIGLHGGGIWPKLEWMRNHCKHVEKP